MKVFPSNKKSSKFNAVHTFSLDTYRSFNEFRKMQILEKKKEKRRRKVGTTKESLSFHDQILNHMHVHFQHIHLPLLRKVRCLFFSFFLSFSLATSFFSLSLFTFYSLLFAQNFTFMEVEKTQILMIDSSVCMLFNYMIILIRRSSGCCFI